MGWFWQQKITPPNPPSNPSNASSSPTTPESQAPAPTGASSSSSDAVDSEIKKFMDMFQAEAAEGSRSNPQGSPHPSSSSTPSSTPIIAAAGKTPASQAISESLLPTEMSCRDAFDYAWHCNTPGAQWNAVYRYGSVRSCTELWDDFWFCMRTKSYTGEMKAEAIRAHFRAKENAKYGPGKPSSEDVWESRDHKVAPGTAFSQRIDGPVESDREWQTREIERRRAIREGMGFEKKE